MKVFPSTQHYNSRRRAREWEYGFHLSALQGLAKLERCAMQIVFIIQIHEDLNFFFIRRGFFIFPFFLFQFSLKFISFVVTEWAGTEGTKGWTVRAQFPNFFILSLVYNSLSSIFKNSMLDWFRSAGTFYSHTFIRACAERSDQQLKCDR